MLIDGLEYENVTVAGPTEPLGGFVASAYQATLFDENDADRQAVERTLETRHLRTETQQLCTRLTNLDLDEVWNAVSSSLQ